LTTFEESTTLFGTVTTRPDGWFVVTSSPLMLGNEDSLAVAAA